uniref:lipocalin family protein n=1 Tax=Maribacter sp. LLG6340-A2 TaxID=3160834 RepID=UPI00386D880E
MKTTGRYVMGLFLITVLFSCKSNKVALEHLEGSWLLSDENNEQLLEYRRIENANMDYGSILTISNDSTITDSYVLKCLNGKNMSKFYSQGTWKINEKSMQLSSTVPIDLQGQNFKIVALDTDKFILSKIKN